MSYSMAKNEACNIHPSDHGCRADSHHSSDFKKVLNKVNSHRYHLLHTLQQQFWTVYVLLKLENLRPPVCQQTKSPFINCSHGFKVTRKKEKKKSPEYCYRYRECKI